MSLAQRATPPNDGRNTHTNKQSTVLYSNGVMTALPVPSTGVYAGDINDSGAVVGSMRAGGGFSNFHGWIYVDGVVTNLNHLIPQGSGVTIVDGQGVGTIRNDDR